MFEWCESFHIFGRVYKGRSISLSLGQLCRQKFIVSLSLTNKGVDYDVKILLAWGECISGNEKITQFLIKNGFTELGLFRYALRNEQRSRDWLMQNSFQHLLALINGIEGREDALKWLKQHGYNLLHEMALAGDGDEEARKRLLKPETQVYAMLAQKMEYVKDQIEDAKNDFHKYSSS